ncbi:ABC transporter permease subunit [Alkalinema sp. FACHB-956]|uniref:ABC transporter permease subunit n=1 Tax=Alkalinema sp. FACHB-956 TaxID=2692768 RepID=UPI0016862EB9|nr:ABC transporter permease subunit [Alkalinema sp. FACHB-956]MBD2329251.1 ABC transporter permease subunit [Alkalinema sp. FACHB-956]
MSTFRIKASLRKHYSQEKPQINLEHPKVKVFLPWIFPITVLLLWQLLAVMGVIPPQVLPAPLSVVTAAIKLTQSGELPRNIGISSLRAISGFIIGGGIGFTLGIINGISRVSESLFDTTLQMLRTIPNLALLPLVILWFGIGDEARLFLVSLGVMFPLYLNTFHGIRQVDPGLIEMGRVYGLNAWQLFWKIILPGAMSSILVGVRFSLGIMWLTLIVAETIAADSGIGYMATNAREFMQTDVIVLAIVMYALFGKLADSVARYLERSWLRWHPNYQKS